MHTVIKPAHHERSGTYRAIRSARLSPLLLLAALLLSACASSGNVRLKELAQSDVLAQVREGESTKTEVEALLGQANSVTFTDSGNEIWTYYYSKSTSHGTNFIPYANIFSSGHNTETKELVILFNEEGVVRKRTMRETTTTHKTGILGKT